MRSPQEGDDEGRKNLRLDEMETSFDFCQQMTKMMDAYREKVGTTLALMAMEKNPSNNDIKKWIMALAKTQVNMDDMACMVTEVVEEMDTMQKEVKNKDNGIRKLREQLDEETTMVSSVVVKKDKLEVKASSKEK